MSTNLTERQKEVLNFIIHEIKTRGFPPTIREMRDALNLHSLRGITVHLDALVKKGFIQRTSQARGIRVLRDSRPFANRGKIEIPLLGEIHAGTPLLAEENIEKYIAVDVEKLKGATNAFALRVKGDSMVEAQIYEGDLAIVSPQATAEDGDIVVALLEDEVTLKKFHRVGDYIALLPANTNYAPIIGREFSIQGKLIGVLSSKERKFISQASSSTLLPVHRP